MLVEAKKDPNVDKLRLTPWRAAGMLTWRELIRFLRQRNRVIGAVGQPILFWLLFGAGMNRTFQVPGQQFSEYFVPGTLVLILLFTAIFATISIIEDRKEGFLQAILVAPTPRWSLVFGKVAGGTILAVGQSLIFLVLSLTLGIRLGFGSAIAVIAMMIVISAGLTCLGFVIAWKLDSTQGFHAIMNLLLMPMWLLSGAFFPAPPVTIESSTSELVLNYVMRCNPVTYGVSGLRHLMFPSTVASWSDVVWLPSLPTCWLVTVLFSVFMFVWASRIATRPTSGDLL